MKKISAVYKITNTITGDFYIGSSKNVKKRWAAHKCPSVWNEHPNNPLYKDMKKYAVDKFEFEILAEVEIDFLKEVEQQFIEMMKPTYNNYNAKGLDIKRQKKYQKEYKKTHKDELKRYHKEYNQSDKYKEHKKQYNNKYKNQFCSFNGEKLTLNALYQRFEKQGIQHPAQEAKKYLIGGCYD